MLTLKQYKVEIDARMLLKYLSVDIYSSDLVSGWKRFLVEETGKTWVGAVNVDQGAFRIRDANAGIFKRRASFIEIIGRLNGQSKSIDLKFGIPWYSVISFVVVLLFFGQAIFFISDLIVSIIIVGLLTIEILFLFIELNNAENRFSDYCEKIQKGN